VEAIVTKTRELTPVLYRCCEDWEHSQRDDSDWYCVAYASTGKLCRVETGTTRCANGLHDGGGVVPMNPEILPLAIEGRD